MGGSKPHSYGVQVGGSFNSGSDFGLRTVNRVNQGEMPPKQFSLPSSKEFKVFSASHKGSEVEDAG